MDLNLNTLSQTTSRRFEGPSTHGGAGTFGMCSASGRHSTVHRDSPPFRTLPTYRNRPDLAFPDHPVQPGPCPTHPLVPLPVIPTYLFVPVRAVSTCQPWSSPIVSDTSAQLRPLSDTPVRTLSALHDKPGLLLSFPITSLDQPNRIRPRRHVVSSPEPLNPSDYPQRRTSEARSL